ncbi:hypothetical protein NMG29_07670 [Streptomyces cocklensis]|uniref:Uncharacterized protein n=1 Tax=Actinacidiphila cocklensis TaxID=887465 RepID=A0A9W4DSG5_9ACTN|nr:hypothetical protein [Actinacidiphila cocklensis]MDD1058107.1 hypothetical protein [Actinacidiphila cocklensis]CAG6393143.1 conserved hypothetical protein [Actinacidiphila cocklensis]
MTSNAPRPTLDKEAVSHHLAIATRRRTPAALRTALMDIPVLLAETKRLATLLTAARTECANLLAAARATLHAQDDGEPDPLSYVRDEVAAHAPLTRDER